MNFHEKPMNTAVIRNAEFIELLDEYADFVKSIDLNRVANLHPDEDADWYCSQEYCNQIMHRGREHFGFPEAARGFEVRADQFRYKDLDGQVELGKIGEELVNEVCMFLGAHRKALSMVYPPGGFIGWHNNANAGGYNIIFTWSEKGDGQWEHIDPITKEHVVIPDVEGWQCKYGYYGTYDEHDKIVYHSARTNCLRSTIAFVFNSDETGKRMAEHVVEEIQTA
jgi:hypothetical protein